MDNYDAEELILSMSEIVYENRALRQEVVRLRKIEKDYHQSINDRCRASEDASRNMLRAAIVGIDIGKSNNKILQTEEIKYQIN